MTRPVSIRSGMNAAFLAVAASIAAPGCVDIVATGSLSYIEREEKQFTVAGRPEVTVSTFGGSIEVRPWDRQEILIVVEKHALSKDAAADIEVIARQEANRVAVETRVRPASRLVGFGARRSARLIVSLPAHSDLRAESGDGSIDVERVSGRIELRSGDGVIRGRELSGGVSAQTGDGAIRLRDVIGSLDVGTGDGSIDASGTLSGLRARSGDGSVSIHVERGSVADEDWSVYTGDGPVILELPEGFSAELDAHTADGRVSVESEAMAGTIERTRRSVRGRLGQGGRSLRVRSGDGPITLRHQ